MLARSTTRAAWQHVATPGLIVYSHVPMISTGACRAAVTAATAGAAVSSTTGSQLSGAASFSTEAASQPPHVVDQHETIVGSQTPGTLARACCRPVCVFRSLLALALRFEVSPASPALSPACPPPVTKRLWLQRMRWTDERLAEAQPRDAGAAQPAKPPNRTAVRYSFASDPVLREHCEWVARGHLQAYNANQGPVGWASLPGSRHRCSAGLSWEVGAWP